MLPCWSGAMTWGPYRGLQRGGPRAFTDHGAATRAPGMLNRLFSPARHNGTGAHPWCEGFGPQKDRIKGARQDGPPLIRRWPSLANLGHAVPAAIVRGLLRALAAFVGRPALHGGGCNQPSEGAALGRGNKAGAGPRRPAATDARLPMLVVQNPVLLNEGPPWLRRGGRGRRPASLAARTRLAHPTVLDDSTDEGPPSLGAHGGGPRWLARGFDCRLDFCSAAPIAADYKGGRAATERCRRDGPTNTSGPSRLSGLRAAGAEFPSHLAWRPFFAQIARNGHNLGLRAGGPASISFNPHETPGSPIDAGIGVDVDAHLGASTFEQCKRRCWGQGHPLARQRHLAASGRRAAIGAGGGGMEGRQPFTERTSDLTLPRLGQGAGARPVP